MRGRFRQVLFLSVGAAAASSFAAVACSYDFHAFDPSSDSEGGPDGTLDAGQDTNVDPGDAGSDAGEDALPTCSTQPPAGCLSDGIACGSGCRSKQKDCEGMCGIINPQQCKDRCAADAERCKQDCRGACETCTGDAGCPDPLRCRDAVDGRDS